MKIGLILEDIQFIVYKVNLYGYIFEKKVVGIIFRSFFYLDKLNKNQGTEKIIETTMNKMNDSCENRGFTEQSTIYVYQ